METFSANGHKRAVLYARVSTDQQADKGYSLPSQLEGCRTYAARVGFQVVAELADDCSGTIAIMDRPKGKELYKLVDSGAVNVVILYTNDRTARDERVLEYLLFKNYLNDHGVELHYSDTGLDPYTMEGNLVGYIKAHAASGERKKIAERTQRGKVQKAKSGKAPVGKLPYGLGKENGAIVINLQEALVVERIFNLRVAGMPCYAIAHQLSDERIPTSGESRGFHRERASGMWDSRSVNYILCNRAYIGEYQFNKESRKSGKRTRNSPEDVITIQIPPIISQEVFDAAQAMGAQRRKSSKRKNFYLMSGRVMCGCGRSMAGVSGNRYSCVTNHHYFPDLEERPCFEKTQKSLLIDGLAWQFVKKLMSNRALFHKMLEESQQDTTKSLKPQQDRVTAIEGLIAKSDKRKRNLAVSISNLDDEDARATLETELKNVAAMLGQLAQEKESLLLAIANTQPITDDDIAETMRRYDELQQDIKGADGDPAKQLYWVTFLDIRAIVKGGVAHLSGRYPIKSASVKLVGAFVGDKLYTRLAGAGGILREEAVTAGNTSKRAFAAKGTGRALNPPGGFGRGNPT